MPNIAIPLHTVIELTQAADGTWQSEFIPVDILEAPCHLDRVAAGASCSCAAALSTLLMCSAHEVAAAAAHSSASLGTIHMCGAHEMAAANSSTSLRPDLLV